MTSITRLDQGHHEPGETERDGPTTRADDQP
jgi:hypothetical protein